MIRAVSRKKDPTVSPPYLSHFHLRTAPFSPDGGAAFFYADAEREQFLNMLLHLTQYSEELLLVTGGPGSGKSALLEKYLSRADEHWQICRISGQSGAQPDQLFLQIAQCFHLDVSKLNPNQLLEALASHLGQVQQQMTPVLVVDDAEQLSDDALEITLRLAELQGEHGRLVGVTLFADSSIGERLQQERFSSIPTPHTLELKRLDLPNTSAYLNHRLRAAGFSGASPFTEKLVKRIYKASGGLPVSINHEANQVLTELAGGGARPQFRPIPLVAGLATIAVGGTLFVALQSSNGNSEPHMNEPVGGTSAPIVRASTQIPATGFDMVMRRGDSLLISCAPTGGEESVSLTQPTKPVLSSSPSPSPSPSAPMTEPPPEPEVTSSPMLQEVPVEDAEPEPVSKPTVVAEQPAAAKAQMDEAQAEGKMAQPEPMAPTKPTAKVAEAPVASSDKAAEEIPELALGIPLIERVEPNPVKGSANQQALEVFGANLTPLSNVAVSWRDGAKVLAADQIEVHDDSHITVRLAVGTVEDFWAIQVTNREGKRSNVIRFHVVPPDVEVTEDMAIPYDKIVSQPPQASVEEGETPAPTPTSSAPAKTASNPPVSRPLVADKEAAETADPTPQQAAAPEKDSQPTKLTASAPPTAESAQPADKPAAQPKSVPAKPTVATKPATTGVPGILGSEWVAERDGGHFTVQLLAASETSTLKSFVSRYSPREPLASYTTKRNGTAMQMLVHGDYPNRAEAESAVNRMSPSLKRMNPWIRPFADVQKEMVKVKAATGSASKSKDEAWVWSQAPDRFGVQLAGATSRQSLQQMLGRHRLSAQTAIVTETRNGKPWYVLLYGSFASREEAARSVKALPSELRAAGPWIRPFADIQDQLSSR